jgi:hypothetical protein
MIEAATPCCGVSAQAAPGIAASSFDSSAAGGARKLGKMVVA